MRPIDIGARSILAVPRVRLPGISEFEREYARKSRPVVIEGVADQWPATGNWPPERFIEECGNRRVLVTHYAGNSSSGARDLRMPMSEYIRTVCEQSATSELGWAGEPASYSLPEFAAELRLPYLVRTPRSETTAFITGPRAWPYRHVSNQFHFHPGLHAFAAQVQGRKLFRLYHPRETRRIGARKPWAPMPSRGDLEMQQYNPAVHHRLTTASCYEVLMQPGDLLFIPAAWWHLVANEEFAIVVTSFYPAPLSQWRLGTLPGIATLFDRLRRHSVWRARRVPGHRGLPLPAASGSSNLLSTLP